MNLSFKPWGVQEQSKRRLNHQVYKSLCVIKLSLRFDFIQNRIQLFDNLYKNEDYSGLCKALHKTNILQTNCVFPLRFSTVFVRHGNF